MYIWCQVCVWRIYSVNQHIYIDYTRYLYVRVLCGVMTARPHNRIETENDVAGLVLETITIFYGGAR